MSLNGVINFYKPPGMTSAQAVAFIKRLTGAKTGHAGTLDPEAAGVLPILLGKATRICEDLMDRPKQYLAEVAFGVSTDTQDAQGKVLDYNENYPSLAEVQAVLPQFTGSVSQLPPQYSALKVDGQTAYKLAREGKTARLAERTVVFYSIDLLSQTPKQGMLLRVRCGKGAYIRTLCHDLGQVLGCPAHMRFLLREESAGLMLDQAYTLQDLEEWQSGGFKKDQSMLTSILDVLPELPRYQVPKEFLGQAPHGVPIPLEAIPGIASEVKDTKVCLMMGDTALGLYRIDGDSLRVSLMLLENNKQHP